MKIYTKTGDSGTTSLFGGQRVDKNSARIKAYGEVDELNSTIGLTIAELSTSEVSIGEIAKKLTRIQQELLVLGADLSAPLDLKAKVPRISKSHVSRLEQEIDSWSQKLPKLRNFILPGGSKVGSQLHLARTVARRAERSIVMLSSKKKINKNILPYINRLSDWFFTLARYVNKLENVKENIWRGRK